MTDMTPDQQVTEWLRRTNHDMRAALELAAIEKGIALWHTSAGMIRAKPPHKTLPAKGIPPSIDIPAPEPSDE